MIDINDYKLVFLNQDKKISKLWLLLLLVMIIGVFFINKNFKYYEYYTNIGEYKNEYLILNVLITDLEKITQNREMYIKNKRFAYEIKEISSNNIYLNDNFYKEVKLFIKENQLQENEILTLNIITSESNLVEYVFKTIWR